MTVEIGRANLDGAGRLDGELIAFLQGHLDDIAPTAPSESQHAFEPAAFGGPGIRLWVARRAGQVVGTAASNDLADHPAHGRDEVELKAMRTDPALRGQGIASRLLDEVLADARARGMTRIWLETGSMDFFAPARALYRKYGFVECPPFAGYVLDPNSTFMTTKLD